MDDTQNILFDDINRLKEIIASQNILLQQKDAETKYLHEQCECVTIKYDKLREQYTNLEEKYNYLKKMLYGKKSEKLTPEDKLQGRLFNEAECGKAEAEDEPQSDEKSKKSTDADITIVKQHERKKAGRKPIPDDVPRREIIHDLPENEKHCCFCNKPRPYIGSESTEELAIEPAKIYANKHIYPKYGPCDCDGFFHAAPEEKTEVISAPAPKRIIPGSIASEGLIAYILTSKFCDSIPFYRLSNILNRLNIDIPRATMCNLTINSFKNMNVFFEVFNEELKKGEFIRMDETTVQVLHEKGRPPESKSYMWVAMGYPARGRPLISFQYEPSRSGDIPVRILDGFHGYLQTDGYAGYNRAVELYSLIHVGCSSHVRRKFFTAYDCGKKNNNSPAYKALLIIKKIYEHEDNLRSQNLPDDVFVEKRKKAVTPVLEELHALLINTKDKVTPKSYIGKAVQYALNEWDKIIRYLDKAYLYPDNNEIERMIKNFVIGRKNWLFSNTSTGAFASAGMYSLIESAKANKLNPFDYLRFLFIKIPLIGDNRDELRKLLPCYVTSDQIKIDK